MNIIKTVVVHEDVEAKKVERLLKVGRISGLTQNRNVTEANDALDWNDQNLLVCDLTGSS